MLAANGPGSGRLGPCPASHLRQAGPRPQQAPPAEQLLQQDPGEPPAPAAPPRQQQVPVRHGPSARPGPPCPPPRAAVAAAAPPPPFTTSDLITLSRAFPLRPKDPSRRPRPLVAAEPRPARPPFFLATPTAVTSAGTGLRAVAVPAGEMGPVADAFAESRRVGGAAGPGRGRQEGRDFLLRRMEQVMGLREGVGDRAPLLAGAGGDGSPMALPFYPAGTFNKAWWKIRNLVSLYFFFPYVVRFISRRSL